jgi:hypothetical protein
MSTSVEVFLTEDTSYRNYVLLVDAVAEQDYVAEVL